MPSPFKRFLRDAPLAYTLMVGVLVALVYAVGAGCAPKRIPVIPEAQTEVGLAGVQQEIENADWHVSQAQKKSPREAAPHYEAATHSHERAQEKLVGAAVAFDKVRKAALKLQAAYDQCKWIGWKTREYRNWLIGLYLGVGALSVVSGLFGAMGFSKLLTMNVPLMGPFVFLRDYLIKKRDGNTGTNVTIHQAPPTVSVDPAPATTTTKTKRRST